MMTAKELKDKQVPELQKLLSETRTELETIRMKVRGNQEKHVHRVNELQRDIARILTVLNQHHND
jgi:ribosomal protein L29